MEVIGKGVYSIAEASRLTKLRAQRVREWFKGRESANRFFKPVFESDYPIYDDEYAISFLDLIELNIGGKLRDANVPLSYLARSTSLFARNTETTRSVSGRSLSETRRFSRGG